MDTNPLGGFLTFMPSDSATLTVNGVTWRLPQRLTGIPLPILIGPGGPGWATNQFGSGRVYIQGGLLAVALMPTDVSGLVTDGGQPLTYTVVEHMRTGRQYTITVPSASSDGVDINSLIVAGSVSPYPFDPMFPAGLEAVPSAATESPTFAQTIPYGSTEYVSIDVSLTVPGLGAQSPTPDAVYIAFVQHAGSPQSGEWNTAAWTTQAPPYIASILVGPNNGGLNLAKGAYSIWLKIVDNPEIPFVQAGTLNIA
jgi:hypothetical protein